MLRRRGSLNSGQKTKQENLQQRHRIRSCPRLLSWWYRCCFSRRLIFDCLVCTSKDGVHMFINSNLYAIWLLNLQREKNLENTMDNYTLYNNFYPYQFPDIYQHALFKVLCRVRWFFIFYKRHSFMCSRVHLQPRKCKYGVFEHMYYFVFLNVLWARLLREETQSYIQRILYMQQSNKKGTFGILICSENSHCYIHALSGASSGKRFSSSGSLVKYGI